MAKKKLGEILMEAGIIDDMQLASALAHHRQWGMPLAQALVDKKFCTPQQVLDALAKQSGMQLFNLDDCELPPANTKLLPQRIAEQFRAVPLRVEGKRGEILVIAIAAPGSIQSLDAIQSVTGKQRVVPYLASDEAIARGIARLYEGVIAPAVTRDYEPVRVENEVTMELEPNGGPPAAVEPTSHSQPVPVFSDRSSDLSAFELSEGALRVIRQAAAHFKVSEAQIVKRVLEGWAAKQKA